MSKKGYTAADVIVIIVIGIPLIVGFSAFGAWIFMLLWNWALVGLFPTAPMLDFYRAWALSLLLYFVGGFFRSSK